MICCLRRYYSNSYKMHIVLISVSWHACFHVVNSTTRTFKNDNCLPVYSHNQYCNHRGGLINFVFLLRLKLHELPITGNPSSAQPVYLIASYQVDATINHGRHKNNKKKNGRILVNSWEQFFWIGAQPNSHCAKCFFPSVF